MKNFCNYQKQTVSLKKRKKFLIPFSVAALLWFSLFPGQGQAQLGNYTHPEESQHRRTVSPQEIKNLPGNIHLGPLKIHPGLSVNELYTSNVFLEKHNPKSAWVTTVTPMIVLQLPIQRHSLQVDYHTEIVEASRYKSNYDTSSHFVNGTLNLNFNRLTILVGDNWECDSTLPLSESDGREDYTQNRVFYEMNYRFATRIMLRGFYANTSRQFKSDDNPAVDPEWDSYTANDIGGAFYYRFLPKTSVLFEYGFTHQNDNDRGLPEGVDRDSDSQRYWLGLMWEPTAKLSGTIKGGYTKRDYEGNSESWGGFTMDADLTYKYSSRNTFILKGFRYPIETSVTDTRVPGPEFAPGIYGTYSITTGGVLTYTHRFTYRISGIAEMSYFNENYSEKGSLGKKRKDNLYTGSLGVFYDIRDWLNLNLRYRYAKNDSTGYEESYQEHLFIGTFSLKF